MQPLDKIVTQLLILKPKIDIGYQVINPIANIKAHPVQANRKQSILSGHNLQGFGKLDFAFRLAGKQFLQMLKNVRSQDISTDNSQSGSSLS
jgi:hypothetical protein